MIIEKYEKNMPILKLNIHQVQFLHTFFLIKNSRILVKYKRKCHGFYQCYYYYQSLNTWHTGTEVQKKVPIFFKSGMQYY